MPALKEEQLPWLQAAPESWRQQLTQASEAEGSERARRLRLLSGYALSGTQLTRLAQSVARLSSEDAKSAGLINLRVAYLSTATMDLVGQALPGSALRHGLRVEWVPLPFGAVEQQILDRDSQLRRAKPDCLIIAFDWRSLGHELEVLPSEEGARSAMERLDAVASGLHDLAIQTVVWQTIVPPAERYLGGMDGRVAGFDRRDVSAVNRHIEELASRNGAILFDAARLAEVMGLARWHDPVQWNIGKMPFAVELIPFQTDALARTIAAAYGRSRRAVVVDLDDTMWGGVVGDEGVAGLRLAQGDALGEAFLDFQRVLRGLRRRGIILAVCSKNEETIARRPFRDHPDMLLREDDFAVFVANWSDKAANIVEIARRLNLGLESLVFVDDNPVERARVREALPDVAVPELPPDPSLRPRILLSAGYFEAVTFAREDASRAEYYAGNARRETAMAEAPDMETFLRSLQMIAHFAGADDQTRSRVVQLLNKTNQFNLTMRKYQDEEIARLMMDKNSSVLQVRLVDRYGDNGIVSVVVCRDSQGRREIENWVMSCRVFGRGLEQAIFSELVRTARVSGLTEISGRFLPTPRNLYAEGLFPKLGFALRETQQDGTQLWSVSAAACRIGDHFMEIRH